jgi:DNA modification methylase
MGMAASAKTTAAGRRGGGVGVAKKCHEETTNRFQKTTNNQKIRFANITYAFFIFNYLCRYLISYCIKCCEVLLA